MENGHADDAKHIAVEALEHIDFVIESSTQPYPRAYYLRCLLGHFLEIDSVNYCIHAVATNRSLKEAGELVMFQIAEDVVLNTIGIMLKEQGDFSNAVEYLFDGLAINPTSSDIMINLAAIYSAHGMHGIATEYYDRAERLIADPAIRSLLMTNRGFSLEKQGFHLAARDIYKEAIGIAGSSPHPQLVLNLENIERYCQQNECN
jgi:tetratricopeptide (TPR) repeat protein